MVAGIDRACGVEVLHAHPKYGMRSARMESKEWALHRQRKCRTLPGMGRDSAGGQSRCAPTPAADIGQDGEWRVAHLGRTAQTPVGGLLACLSQRNMHCPFDRPGRRSKIAKCPHSAQQRSVVPAWKSTRRIADPAPRHCPPTLEWMTRLECSWQRAERRGRAVVARGALRVWPQIVGPTALPGCPWREAVFGSLRS